MWTPQFIEKAGDYGVEVTRITSENVRDAIREAIEGPTVGVPLPFDAELPESVAPHPHRTN